MATALAVLGPPAVGVVRVIGREPWGQVREQALGAFSITTLAYTVLYALAIGVIACILAWPTAAWVTAGSAGQRAARLALTVSPLLLPNYLPYAGWGLLRGPNTALGDWLARQHPDWTIVAGKVTALGGMALWSWPIAAVILAAGRDHLGSGLTDLLRLDQPGPIRRTGLVIAAMRRSVIAAVLAVALVMAGSAIPLHVAQVPTHAIQIWKAMQLVTSSGGLWIAALPSILVAAAAAVWLTRSCAHLSADRPESGLVAARPIGRPGVAAVVVWALAVLVPLALFAWSLHSWRSIPMFWKISGTGVAHSLRVAGVVAAGAAGLLLCTWAAVDSGRRVDRLMAGLTLGLMATAGLMPGVLVGAAVNAAGGEASFVSVVACHLARFGWLAVVAGWWLAQSEPAEQRALRQTEGGSWLAGWMGAAVRPRVAAVVGMALAAGSLSLHEIESTVFVLPPGSENLAQQLLDYLHYARDEQLSAAAVNLLGLGVVASLLTGWLIARGGAFRRGAGVPVLDVATNRTDGGSV